MMSGYTKGPWIVKHISGSNFAVQRFEIRSGSGMPHPIFNKDANAIDGTTVCVLPQDAKLIAAAPDLLEVLQMAREMLNRNLPTLDRNVGFCPNIVSATVAAIDAIDIAIAKALA